MSNTFGTLFRLTSFGESHGPGVGGIIDGCPAGLPLSDADIQKELNTRRPSPDPDDPVSTRREEPDRARLFSGVFEGKTTGMPITFYAMNRGHNPGDYETLRNLFRPGHADFAVYAKYGRRDYRGGGRSSARETLARVAGGAIAQKLLAKHGITLVAYTLEFAGLSAPLTDVDGAENRPFFAPDKDIADSWKAKAVTARTVGDTLGGLIRVEARNVPPGLGEPVFDKLDARLAYAVMGIGSIKGVEIGSGFAAARMTGSEHNDPITPKGFLSNNSGGILGGISSGQNIVLTAAVKPVPSINMEQNTVTEKNEATTLWIGGRHDVSPIPRVVPVAKAMVALVLADFLLLQGRQRL